MNEQTQSEQGQSEQAAIQALTKSYEAYCDWWSARAKTENPLPPNAAFYLGRVSILLTWALETRVFFSGVFDIDPSCVNLQFEKDDREKIRPMVTLDPPQQWIPKNLAVTPGNIEQTVQEYVSTIFRREMPKRTKMLDHRLACYSQKRDDLQPKTIVDFNPFDPYEQESTAARSVEDAGKDAPSQ